MPRFSHIKYIRSIIYNASMCIEMTACGIIGPRLQEEFEEVAVG